MRSKFSVNSVRSWKSVSESWKGVKGDFSCYYVSYSLNIPLLLCLQKQEALHGNQFVLLSTESKLDGNTVWNLEEYILRTLVLLQDIKVREEWLNKDSATLAGWRVSFFSFHILVEACLLVELSLVLCGQCLVHGGFSSFWIVGPCQMNRILTTD